MKQAKGAMLAGLLCAALSAGGLASQARDNQAEVALQAAIKAETVDGNLTGAIEQYRKLADGGDHAVAAKALVRMGLCYEKLGEEQAREARQAYERVVRDFGDQAEVAAQARARLAVLSGPVVAGGPVARRILSESLGSYGSLSRDGRLIYFFDVENEGDVILFELAGGKKTRIPNRGVPEAKESPYEYAALSRDGKQIAYDTYSNDAVPQLKIRNLDGSSLRTILSEKRYEARPLDWSPDSKFVLGYLELEETPDGGIDLVLISAEDGAVRILKKIASSWMNAQFSPDGKSIAFSFMAEGNPPQSDLHIMAAEGGDDVVVAGHPAEDELIGWSPDGRSLIFLSDRSGTWGLWRVLVNGGKPQGEPELLKKEFDRDAEVFGLAPDGSLYYSMDTAAGRLFTGEIDLETGKVLVPPSPLTTRYAGLTPGLAWSPDGKSLAFYSRPGEIRPGNMILTIRSAATGEERFLSPRLRGVNQYSWAPDSRSIVGLGFTVTGYGIFRVDVETSATTKLTDEGVFPRLCPDGKTLVFFDGEGTYRRQALDTGQKAEIVKKKQGMIMFDLSPDGREMVFQDGGVIKIVSLGGGPPRDIYRGPAGANFGLTWMSDGRGIVARRLTAGDCEIWRIPVAGGAPLKLDLAFPRVVSFALHPDNRRFAFAAADETKSELWVLENFLPPAKAGK